MSEPFDWTLPEGWEFPGGEVNIPHTLKEIQDGQYVGEKQAASYYASNNNQWDVPEYVRQEFYVSNPEDIQAAVDRVNAGLTGTLADVIAANRSAARRRKLAQVGSNVCKAQRKARRA